MTSGGWTRAPKPSTTCSRRQADGLARSRRIKHSSHCSAFERHYASKAMQLIVCVAILTRELRSPADGSDEYAIYAICWWSVGSAPAEEFHLDSSKTWRVATL